MSSAVRPLSASFFRRPAEQVARDLLGRRLESRLGSVATGGWIVETEAYLGYDDPASHAYRGRRHAGNAAIYGPPGSWYVYRAYGIHWCINLVTAPPGRGAAVLIRAIRPDRGLTAMRRRREGQPDRRLTDGPGKLSQALGIAQSLDGEVMWRSPVVVTPGEPIAGADIEVTPRVGITKAAEWPLRFLVRAG